MSNAGGDRSKWQIAEIDAEMKIAIDAADRALCLKLKGRRINLKNRDKLLLDVGAVISWWMAVYTQIRCCGTDAQGEANAKAKN